MSRFTYKDKNENYQLYDEYIDEKDIDENGLNEITDYIGKLEDLEEKLGCPLEVFVKFILGTHCLYYEQNSKLIKCSYRLENLKTNDFSILISYDYHNPNEYNPYRSWRNGELNARECYWINIKDYKKTWWLKEDRSE